MLNNHPLLNYFFGYEAQRKRLLKKIPHSPLHDFLSVPMPSLKTPLENLPILSVDFETTGLSAVNDKLLSVGCVALNQNQIILGSCYHQIINAPGSLHADNVKIHQITDKEKAQGQSLSQTIAHLLQQLTGKVMLVHFSTVERNFLRQACLELYGFSPPLPIIDTLMIEKRTLDKKNIAYDPCQLRLSFLRDKYHLPEYYAHNALNDAVATAELYLTQISQMPHNTTLAELIL